MVFIKQTMQYVRKNFFHLCALALVPSLAYAFNHNNFNIPDFLISLKKGGNFLRFGYVYKSFSILNYNKLYLTLFSLLAAAVFVALTSAFIEKHMRIGKKSFGGLIYKLNDNIMPVCFLMFLFLAFYEIWAILLSAVLVMLSLIAGVGSAIFYSGLFIILLFYTGLFFTAGLFLIWLPCLLMTGFNAREAFVYSISLLPEKFSTVLTMSIPFIVAVVLEILSLVYLGAQATFIIRAVIFVLLFIYYNALMFVAYFSLSNEPREDLKKKYFK